MADWRSMMEDLGLQNPRTLIATGNAVFESRGRRQSFCSRPAGNPQVSCLNAVDGFTKLAGAAK